MAECKENVGRGIVSFPCTLPPDHDGPHMAVENGPSVHARKAWEAAVALEELEHPQPAPVPDTPREVPHPGAEPLAVFQGAPKTSSEGLMEHGQPIPTIDTNAPGLGKTVYGRPRTAPPVEAPQPTLRPEVIWAAGPQEFPPPTDQASTVAEVEDRLPTKVRPGDQRLPEVNEGVYVQDLVIDDIELRKAVGIERYGTPLQTFNGRNVDLDLYEEILDAAMYLRQKVVEREELARAVEELADELERLLGGSLPAKVASLVNLLYQGTRTE